MPQPQWGDNEYDLLFKAVENLEPFVDGSNYMRAQWGDLRYDLLFKLASNISNISGGGGTTPGPIPTIATPANATDFSGLPGGVAPPAGEDKIYWAIKDAASYWTIGSGDTQWTEVWKNA